MTKRTRTQSLLQQSLRIPSCLQVIGRTADRLELRLAGESDRRQWDLNLEVRITPKRMQGSRLMEPRRYRDERTPDLSAVWDAAETLPRVWKGRLYGTDISMSFEGCDHSTGIELLEVMLSCVERTLRGEP